MMNELNVAAVKYQQNAQLFDATRLSTQLDTPQTVGFQGSLNCFWVVQ